MVEMKLKDFAGQHADVVLVKTRDGSKVVQFTSKRGYGYPTVTLRQLEKIVKELRNL